MNGILTTEYEKALWGLLEEHNPPTQLLLDRIGLSPSTYYRYKRLKQPIRALKYEQVVNLIRVYKEIKGEVA